MFIEKEIERRISSYEPLKNGYIVCLKLWLNLTKLR